MSDDDEMPELEDFTEQLKEIRKAKGIDEKNVPTELKIGVINEKNNTSNTNTNKNNTVQIPISTNPPPKIEKQAEPPKPKPQNTNNNNKNNNKRDEDNFGCGLFKRGFLKRHNFSEDEPKKNTNKEKEKPKEKPKEKEKNEPVDLTHIK
jgi:hypothetical protein